MTLSFDGSELEKWIADYVIHEGVCRHYFDGMGTGIKALRDIPPGRSLVSVSPERYITSKSISKFGLISAKNGAAKLNDLDCMVAILIIEDSLGSASAIAPYIESLPRTFSNPLFLMISENSEIPDDILPEIKELLEEQRCSLLQSWKHMKEWFRQPEMDYSDSVLSRSRFLWAWFIVATRSLYLASDMPALVPFVDFFNHSPTAKMETRFDPATQVFQIFTNDSYKAGDQVFINYGSHSNFKLAVYYGFVAERNPFSSVNFDILDVLRRFPLSKRNLDFLDKYDVLRCCNCSWGGFSNNLECILRMTFYDGLEPWNVMGEEGIPQNDVLLQKIVLLLKQTKNIIEFFAHRDVGPLIQTATNEQVMIIEHMLRKLMINTLSD